MNSHDCRGLDFRIGMALLLGLVLSATCLISGTGPVSAGSVLLPGDDAEKDEKELKAEKRKRLQALIAEYEAMGPGTTEVLEKLKEIGALRIREAAMYLVDVMKKAPEEKGYLVEFAVRALGENGTDVAVQTLLVDAFKVLPERRYSLVSEVLPGVKDPKALDWLFTKGFKALPTLKPAGQEQFLRVLRGSHDTRLVSVASKLISNRRLAPASQAQLIEILAENDVKSSAKKIAGLFRTKDHTVQVAVLRAIHRLGAEKHGDVFFKALKSKFWQVRATSVDMMRQTRQRELIGSIAPLLDDVSPEVRIACVQALLELGGDEAMDPLIAALDGASGRVKDDIAEALVKLTGKDFGTVAANWESWWSQNRGMVEIASISQEEYDKLKEEGENAATGVYYGLRIISQFVAFVVDVSDSMNEPYLVKTTSRRKGRKGPNKGGKTGVDPEDEEKGGKEEEEKEQKKIEVARTELIKALASLEDGVHFNITKFSSFPTPWKKQLVKMNPAIRNSALDYAKGLSPAGMTNVYDTIMGALQDPMVNTIYFLSDGAPTSGQYLEAEEILSRIREANRLRKVKIYTIGFHLNPQAKELMRKLAEENYGRFVER